jgi:hypothetical protein
MTYMCTTKKTCGKLNLLPGFNGAWDAHFPVQLAGLFQYRPDYDVRYTMASLISGAYLAWPAGPTSRLAPDRTTDVPARRVHTMPGQLALRAGWPQTVLQMYRHGWCIPCLASWPYEQAGPRPTQMYRHGWCGTLPGQLALRAGWPQTTSPTQMV